jgi:hypothetical protein
MFTHATVRTSDTATASSHSEGRIAASTASDIDRRLTDTGLYSGLGDALSTRSLITASSAAPCATVIPGLRRPVTYARPPRLCRSSYTHRSVRDSGSAAVNVDAAP